MRTIIVGGGLAGLSCALELEKRGEAPLLLEASDRVGGRTMTDEVDGFLLDRGFQVLLNNYPMLQTLYQDENLGLRCFPAGAMVRMGEKWKRVSSPLRRPSLRNAWQFAKLAPVLWAKAPSTSTNEWLKQLGISSNFIHHFLRPFFGGVFLDNELETSAAQFQKSLKAFLEGSATLPKEGMEALPKSLVSRLQATEIRCNTPVASVEPYRVKLTNGEELEGKRIIVATSGPTAAKLLGKKAPRSCQVTCCYFAIRKSFLNPKKLLYLDGNPATPITNLAFLSKVQPSYAPTGYHLASATVLQRSWQERDDLEEAVRNQLAAQFRPYATDWEHLRTYRIEHALPAQTAPSTEAGNFRGEPGIYQAYEGVVDATINDALAAGVEVCLSFR